MRRLEIDANTIPSNPLYNQYVSFEEKTENISKTSPIKQRGVKLPKFTGDRALDSGKITDQNLNITAEEKPSESDVQEYKMWLYERGKEDMFEALVQWVEIRMQIMEEAKEKSDAEIASRRTDGRLEDRYKNRQTQVYTSQTRSQKSSLLLAKKTIHLGNVVYLNIWRSRKEMISKI